MDKDFRIGLGVTPVVNEGKIQSDINKQVKDIRVKAAIEIEENNNKINSQIKNLKLEAIKVGVAISDKSAEQAIKNINKEYASLQTLSGKNKQLVDTSKLKDATSLLSQQKSEYQAIWDINKKISTLNPTKNSNEINALSEQKKLHQENYLNIQKQLGSYSDIINNEARVNSLLEIQKKTQSEINIINSKKFDKSVVQDTEKQIAAEKKLQDEIKKTAHTAQNTLNLNSEKIQLANRITSYIQNNTRLSDHLKDRLIEIKQQLNSVDKAELNNLKNEFREVTTQANALGQTGDTFFAKLQKNSKQFLNYLGSATVIMSGIRAIRGMISDVKELDKAIISLRKVTDETEESYARFLKTAIASAKSLGSSVSDIVEMTATWAKLGYTIEESSKLAEVSTVYANVADIKSTDTAVSDLVTVMKAYNIEAKDAIIIADKFNEIGNKYATDAASLGEGLRNAASSLNLAGNDIDKSLAMLTAMTEITQNASESGNALKILSLRLRGMRGELEKLGEESEGIESISKIQTQILNLTSGKVNIFDDLDPTKFKSTYDIMLGISKVWKDMAETDQAELLELISGKQRANSIAALLSNMSQAENVLQTSIESSGSAMREQEEYMKGIQYSTDRLKASFQELASSTINSSWVKGFIDLANILTNVVNKVGLLNIALASLAVAFNVRNGTVLLGFIDSLVAKLGIATGAATTLSFALSAIIPVVAIIGGIKLLDTLITTTAEQAEKVEELASAYKSAQSEVDSINKELESQTNLMNDLLAKDKLTYAEQGQLEELKEITEELQIQADIEENKAKRAREASAIEAANLINRKYGTESVSQLQVNEYLEDAEMRGGNQFISTDAKDIAALVAGYKKFTELKKEAFDSKNNSDYEHFKDLTKEYTDILWDNVSVLQEQKANMRDYFNIISDTPYDEMTSDQKNVYDAYNNTSAAIKLLYSELEPSKWNSRQIDSIFNNESIEKTKDELIQMAKSGELSINTITESYKNLNKEIESSDLILDGKDSVQAFVDEIYALASATPEATVETKRLNATVTDAISGLDKISKSMSSLDSAYAKLKSKEKIDMSDITALQEAFGKTEGFDDFITTISTAGSVTEEVQDKFNRLVDSYINGSGVMDNLNDSTKDLIISQLEEKGITNANEIVTKRLSQQKQILAETGVDVVNATIKEMTALANLETTSESTRVALVNLAAQKLNVNNVALSSSSDLESLGKLMTAANATSESLKILEYYKDPKKFNGFNPGQIDMKALLQKAQAEADAFFANLNSTNYSGGSKTRSIKPKKEKKEKKEFSKTFDWIAIRIEKLKETAQKAIDSVANYISYKNKNKQLELAIKTKVDEKSSLYGDKKSYENLAKKVGLAKKYRDLVDNGGINVQTIKDEKLAKKIDEYKQWRDAAKDVGEKIGDINKAIEELNSQKLDNIKSYFDMKNNYKESKISKREGIISLKEAKGKSASKSDYDYLIKEQKGIISNKQKEYSAYKKEIQNMLKLGSKNGGFDKLSDEYYAAIGYLNELNIAANEARKSIIDLSNEKIKLNFKAFDDGIAKIDSAISEINQAANLVDDNSIEQITLFQTGYQQTAIKAKELNEEIAKLNKQFAKNKDSVVYKERLKDLESQLSNNASAMKSYEQSIISAMKSRYDKQLKLNKDALDEELKNIEKLKKAKIDALNEELKKYKEIIDAQKKALKDQQATDNYNEQVTKFNTEISKMESRIELLKKAERTGDREAGKERKQLEDDLAKKKEELAKLQKDRGIDLAIDALDEEYDAYEKMKNQEIKDTEKKYELDKTEAQKVFDLKESNLNKLYENEKRLIIEAANLTKSQFSEAFEEINRTLSQYGMSASPELSDIFSSTQKSVSGTATEALLRSGTGNTGNSELNQYIKSKYGKYLSYSEMVELAKMLGVSGINSTNDVQGTTSNRTKILNALKKAGFSEGGYVDASMIRQTGEHGLALVKHGEPILTVEQGKQFKELINNIQPLNNLVKLSAPDVSNLVTNNNNSPVIQFNLNGGTITPEAMPQFNKWKSDIANEVSKIIMSGARQR